ncbi:MAG: hypothetical protein HN813_02650 [Rhodospirillaceae bacterium]|jgi:hypothetical protein|nr:hypothetical protein [Rhodospirillaceae bacterium]MBT7360857.1 hypothetical protein [Rhodospirillaceae bacterium]
MSLINTTAYNEGILGFHDPTLGADVESKFDGAEFFSTLLDIINPLQHIPLVSNLYREITGDQISPTASILGGGLFGGPIGLASASANAIFEQASGDDILGHALAAFSDVSGPDIAPQQAGTPIIHEQANASGHAAVDPAEDTAGDVDAGIVMGGPSALASLKPAPVASNAPVSLAPPVKTQTTPLIDQPINNAAQTAESPMPAGVLPTNWVNEALRDAATMNEAVQSGAAPAFGETKPWVGNAILDALTKYEALTKARTSPPAN